MELTTHIESLQKSLQAASAPAGKDVAQAAELLSQALEPAARLALLEAMSAAADEITVALDHTSVEARLRGSEVEFTVSESTEAESDSPPPDPSEAESSGDVARITLRLPDSLKISVERAAAGESISVNGWLVSAIARAVETGREPVSRRRHGRRNRSFRGFARS